MRFSRYTQVVGVLFAAYLVVSVAPIAVAAPGEQLVVGSQHSTASDFENGTLTNMTTEGSGESAVATLDNRLIEGFESGNLDSYSTSDQDAFDIVTAPTYSGTYALEADSTAGGSPRVIISDDKSTTSVGNTYSYKIRFANNDQGDMGFIFGANGTDSSDFDGYEIYLREESSSEIEIRRYDDGSLTTIDGVSTGYPTGEWLDVDVTWAENGDISVTVTDSSGNQVVSASGSDTTYSEGGHGYRTANDGPIYIDEVFEGSGDKPADSWEYVSPNHSVSGAEQAAINISQLENVDATLQVEYHDGSQWVEANSTTATTGNQTLTLPEVNSETWRVKASISPTDVNPQFDLADDSILFTDHAPEIDNASASPSGGSQLSSQSVTLSVDVSDQEFGTVQGESLTVEFYEDGSKVATETVNSNGTASTTITEGTGGSHTWHAVVTDAYGLSTTSQTFSFEVPGTLSIYNETSPGQLVNNSVTADVTFYGSDGSVVQRSTTDGKIDMTGLPANEEFAISITADGYHERTVLVDSLYEQQNVYILSEAVPEALIVFSIDDATGRFQDEETVIIVDRALNVSGSTEFKAIAGDRLGATGDVPVDLEDGATYRIRVRNEAGEERVLGRYKVSGDANAPLPIGKVRLTGDTEKGVAVDAAVITDDTGNRSVRFVYRDPAEETSQLQVEIVYANNTSKYLRMNTTEVGPYGRYIETTPIPDGVPDNTSFLVRYHADRTGGDLNGEIRVGGTNAFLDNWTDFLDPQVLSLMGWLLTFAVTGLVILVNERVAGMVGVIMAGILSMWGVMEVPEVALGLAGGTALLFFLAGRR